MDMDVQLENPLKAHLDTSRRALGILQQRRRQIQDSVGSKDEIRGMYAYGRIGEYSLKHFHE